MGAQIKHNWLLPGIRQCGPCIVPSTIAWFPSYIFGGFFSIVRGGVTCLGLLYT